MADTAGGNPGMNKLARVLQQRIKETMEDGIGDIEPDFGVIGKDGSLTTNMFPIPIPKGEYYLIETEAPGGFEKNPTAVPVIVDDTGVYADAGKEEDMVSVNLGVGKLVKSMVQFAADDDIDATLHDIKAALETGTYENKKWNWTETEDNVWNSTDPEKIMHLSYSSTNAVLELSLIHISEPTRH